MNYVTSSLLMTEMVKGKAQKKIEFKKLDWDAIDRNDNEVITKIVSKMETMLRIPE